MGRVQGFRGLGYHRQLMTAESPRNCTKTVLLVFWLGNSWVDPKPYRDADEPYFDLCKAIIIRNRKKVGSIAIPKMRNLTFPKR